MAGFTKLGFVGANVQQYEFHIDTPNVAERIRQANDNKRVITMQLDGDELAAALWGLENYTKSRDDDNKPLRTIKHVDGCHCRISRECAQNTLGAKAP